jgi:hypothetical protein
MGYRETTYIVFDGDRDRWAYASMRGWKALDNIDFDFRNAHDLRDIRDWSLPETGQKDTSPTVLNSTASNSTNW